jgi:hypothetical protein
MKRGARDRRLEQCQQGWPPPSMTTFFDYLLDHEATTEYTKALGEVVMLRACGARPPAG